MGVTAANLVVWIGLVVGAAVAGALLGLTFVRWRLVRRVRSELGKEKVLLVTNSRLGLLKEGRAKAGRPRDAGILMLLKNGLYYHSWFRRREIFIPGPSITYIGVATLAAGASESDNVRSVGRGSVVLQFLNAKGKEDGVVIRLLSPDQWVSAIKTHLIARPV